MGPKEKRRGRRTAGYDYFFFWILLSSLWKASEREGVSEYRSGGRYSGTQRASLG